MKRRGFTCLFLFQSLSCLTVWRVYFVQKRPRSDNCKAIAVIYAKINSPTFILYFFAKKKSTAIPTYLFCYLEIKIKMDKSHTFSLHACEFILKVYGFTILKIDYVTCKKYDYMLFPPCIVRVRKFFSLVFYVFQFLFVVTLCNFISTIIYSFTIFLA